MPLSLSERDLRVIWHPYTQHKNRLPPIAIASASGAFLYDEQGVGYLDAISSWWVTLHGHAHPYIAKKIYEQACLLEQVIFTGFTHEPAVKLAERLLPLLPGAFSKIFYSDNGSTAVEVAIKMAIQFWQNQPPPAAPRNKIIAFKNAYHGDTFGAMSVSDRGVFTLAFQEYLFEVIFIDTPDPDNFEEIRRLIASQGESVACFIYEPLLQGAGGMRMYDALLLDELLREMRLYQIVCIADEVLTGFGRTGETFAGSYINQKADIICLSKGLTGGSMALGVTAAREHIFEAFLSDDRSRTFFHGHSFTANPIACAAALASLDLLEKPTCRSQIDFIASKHNAFLMALKDDLPQLPIKNPRQLGTILAFEMVTGRDGYLNNLAPLVTDRALKNGIYLRPLGNTVYLMPPYCVTGEDLDRIYTFLLGLMAEIS